MKLKELMERIDLLCKRFGSSMWIFQGNEGADTLAAIGTSKEEVKWRWESLADLEIVQTDDEGNITGGRTDIKERIKNNIQAEWKSRKAHSWPSASHKLITPVAMMDHLSTKKKEP